MKFSRQFFEQLTKNCTETLNKFRGTLQRILEEIWKGAHANLPRGASKRNRTLCINSKFHVNYQFSEAWDGNFSIHFKENS